MRKRAEKRRRKPNYRQEERPYDSYNTYNCLYKSSDLYTPRSRSTVSSSYGQEYTLGRYYPGCAAGYKGIAVVFFAPLLLVGTMLFLTWSIFNIYSNVILGSFNTIVYGTMFFFLGAYVGKQEVYSMLLRENASKDPSIPNNYSTVIFVILNIILKAFWGYFYLLYINIPCIIYIIDMITSSLVTGFFIARTISFFKAYLQVSSCTMEYYAEKKRRK